MPISPQLWTLPASGKSKQCVTIHKSLRGLVTNNTLHSHQLLHTSGPPAVVTAVTLQWRCWTCINPFWLSLGRGCASASQTRISVFLQQLLQPLSCPSLAQCWSHWESDLLSGLAMDLCSCLGITELSRALYLKSSLNTSHRAGWGGSLQASSHFSMQTGLFILWKHKQIQQKIGLLDSRK